MARAKLRQVQFSRRFQLGKTVWTRGVNDQVADSATFAKFILSSLRRHACGNWGDLDDEDKATNEEALQAGERILSAYEQKGLPKIWIITEADRSVTTILFPEEY